MPLPLAPGTYLLDLMHTQIGFTVLHLGLTPIRGAFANYSGQLLVGDTLEDCHLEASIDLLSLQSTNAGREQHVQGEDFFASDRYPNMSFTSTHIEGGDSIWSVSGDLSLRGITRPVAFEARLTGRTVFPMDKKEHIGFVASGSLSRSVFQVGSRIPATILSDEIQVDLAVQLIPRG